MKWSKDEIAERKLEEFGLVPAVMTVAIKDIDLEESIQNNARISDPLLHGVVEEYGLAMKRGDQFPRIVLLARKGKGHLIISGNHRTHGAAEAFAKEVEAYVIECSDPMIIDLLPRCLNRVHGVRQTKEEALTHAIYSINKYGKDPDQAAEMFGLKPDWLKDELRAMKISLSLEEKGIQASKLPKTTILKLGALSNNSNVLEGAAKVAVNARMPTGDVVAMVDAIRKQKTELSQIAAIADYEKATENPGKAPKHKRSVRTKFLMVLKTFEVTIASKTSLLQLQITEPNEQKEIKKRLGELSARIATLGAYRGVDGKKGNR